MNKRPLVLVAEDERSLGVIIKDALESAGMQVVLCQDGLTAYECYRSHSPDVIVLDVMMPLLDGIGLTQKIRRNDVNTPVLLLTAKTQTKDVVQGFHAGCNDYLRKPFGLDELEVRVWSLLGKHGKMDVQIESFSIGNYVFQPKHQTLTLGAEVQRMTHRESELLWLLVQNKGQVVQRSQLLLQVWGADTFFAGRSMDVFVTKLRKRLSGDPSIHLLNIRGIGYKLVD